MHLPSKQTVFLYTIISIINLLPFSAMISCIWTSPALPQLTGRENPENNPLGTPITTAQVSLIGSLYLIGAIFGPFLCMAIEPKFGKKNTIMFFAVLTMVSFLVYAFATTIEVYYIARFIGGLAGGATNILVPFLSAEMAGDSQRGRLGSLTSLFIALGALYTYTLGIFLSIKWFSLSGLSGPCVLMIACVTFVPETPFYWVLRKNEVEAEKVLKQIRSRADIKEELNKIKDLVRVEEETGQGKLTDIIRSKAARKGMFLLMGIIFFKQFSGPFVIQVNLETIFIEAGSAISTEISLVIFGVVKVLSLSVPLSTVDCWGRRKLLLLSGTGIFISQACLGTYYYLHKHEYNLDKFNWVPIFGLVFFILSFNSGMAVIPLVLIGEIYEQKLKSLASVITSTFGSAIEFIVVFVHPFIVESVGIEYSFWIFSLSGILGTIFVYFYLPETKGKSLLEIQKIMEE